MRDRPKAINKVLGTYPGYLTNLRIGEYNKFSVDPRMGPQDKVARTTLSTSEPIPNPTNDNNNQVLYDMSVVSNQKNSLWQYLVLLIIVKRLILSSLTRATLKVTEGLDSH